uniref:Ketoacyl_synth_N domain-containing protein n=1 Tax=Heterorhabditis bacteriophora TaxID=37862 RepID=A0A1I7XSP8_HETBA
MRTCGMSTVPFVTRSSQMHDPRMMLPTNYIMLTSSTAAYMLIEGLHDMSHCDAVCFLSN